MCASKPNSLNFASDPLGIVFVVGGADVVRARGKVLHVGAEIVRAGNGAELFFPLALGARRFGGIAEERLLVGNDVTANGRESQASKQK